MKIDKRIQKLDQILHNSKSTQLMKRKEVLYEQRLVFSLQQTQNCITGDKRDKNKEKSPRGSTRGGRFKRKNGTVYPVVANRYLINGTGIRVS